MWTGSSSLFFLMFADERGDGPVFFLPFELNWEFTGGTREAYGRVKIAANPYPIRKWESWDIYYHKL